MPDEMEREWWLDADEGAAAFIMSPVVFSAPAAPAAVLLVLVPPFEKALDRRVMPMPPVLLGEVAYRPLLPLPPPLLPLADVRILSVLS